MTSLKHNDAYELNELIYKDFSSNTSFSAFCKPQSTLSTGLVLQMDVESECQSKSPKFNQFGFTKEELSFDTAQRFYEADTETKNLDNMSDILELQTKNDSFEEMKMEEEKEEQSDFRGSRLNNGMGYQLSVPDVAVAQQFFGIPSQGVKKPDTDSNPSLQGNFSQRPINSHREPAYKDRHFLEVHMRKCMHHALRNLREVYENIRSYFFDELEEPAAFSEKQKQEFILKKTMEFKDWLEHLKKRFKDYGKEDFKTAYLINHKQFGQEVRDLGDSDIPKFLKNRAGDWNQMACKEILRRLSLKFIRSTSENGLRHQLISSNDILVEAEQLRYVILTEWLVEKPSRIENPEVFDKLWIERFFKSKGL